MKLVRFAVASSLTLLLLKEAAAEACITTSQWSNGAPCKTVVQKSYAASSPPSDYSFVSALALPPPPSPPFPGPAWVYIGTGIVDAHLGERRIYVNGRPTDRYTGVTLITPFEQSQYNSYPLGPEVALSWKTPSLAGYGITDIAIGVSVYRNSTYKTATVAGFRFGHDLAAGINAGLIVGPVFSGYSQPIAVAAELEFDLKDIALSQGWGIADVLPPGLVIKNRVMPGKVKVWEAGQGANAAFELWAGLRVHLP